jgi:hypothetical protein
MLNIAVSALAWRVSGWNGNCHPLKRTGNAGIGRSQRWPVLRDRLN